MRSNLGIRSLDKKTLQVNRGIYAKVSNSPLQLTSIGSFRKICGIFQEKFGKPHLNGKLEFPSLRSSNSLILIINFEGSNLKNSKFIPKRKMPALDHQFRIKRRLLSAPGFTGSGLSVDQFERRCPASSRRLPTNNRQ